MSEFCKNIEGDANARAICEHLADSRGFGARDLDVGVARIVRPEDGRAHIERGRPDGEIDSAEVYARAVELAEAEEDGQRARYLQGGDHFHFEMDCPFQSFLRDGAGLRIPWLLYDGGRVERSNWLFSRIQWKVEGFMSTSRLAGADAQSPAYKRELALKIFEFIRKSPQRGGMGISFDKDGGPHSDIYEVIESRKATCIEFVNLYLAIARQAGLDARPVEVYDDNEGRSIDHLKIGIPLGDGWDLFLDLKTGVGMREGKRWSYISKSDLVAYDYNARALLNCRGEDGETDAECVMHNLEYAHAVSPHQYMVLYNLGYYAHETGDLESSAEYFMRARDEFPQHARTRYNLSTVLGELGKAQDASEEMSAYEDLTD